LIRNFITYPKRDSFNVEQFIKDYEGDRITFLNGNYDSSRSLLAFGEIDELIIKDEENALKQFQEFVENKQDWIFGYLSYDLKNSIEKLSSRNHDGIGFPLLHFFQPKYVVIIDETTVKIGGFDQLEQNAKEIYERLNRPDLIINKKNDVKPEQIKAREAKNSYLRKIKRLKEHIYRGDIYEANFCHEFYIENTSIDAREIFKRLNQKVEAPFSCYYQLADKFLMCGSPERYLKKEGRKIISQPIKGTIKRGKTTDEDNQLRQKLFDDPKERSENVMIVDLVRNDLSKIAKKGSVNVEELFGVYTFNTVHQMISTISAQIDDSVRIYDILESTFPMGSMTGAPKIRAMELIEELEETKRGLYSGAVGYITPEGDFDFNVVIRSILYNEDKQYVSVMVGSAITAKSNPEREYDECLLKATAMFEALKPDEYATSI